MRHQIFQILRPSQESKAIHLAGDNHDTLRAMKLQVERQTHLPASRYEAWEALRAMLPGELWKENAQVFGALESIYRYNKI